MYEACIKILVPSKVHCEDGQSILLELMKLLLDVELPLLVLFTSGEFLNSVSIFFTFISFYSMR